ncbi:RNA polymerase sigma factor sigV [uncultured Roseburia sp.]|uniref:RNA polymerase sigma factor n=1 Tax=Brotonthovivens ammoniilytica TaxID=2981725 RepID=A0ABT2TMQ3_9FIRM|nr:RNA polymerase sigma factor [Brotonthovivens ammoniilytica]MCU6763505.1 RNA polymerase sigma factor [Brotonthovivens ammoniilytica]SCJ21728.1 RNA polymerase sigma factor sigV [uncultured Roseburia sp.]
MKRNADRFAEKYKEIYQDLFRFALYLLKNQQDAEDAVSETVLDAWKSIHTLRKESAFKAWMFRILTAKCKQRLKSYLIKTQLLPETLAAPEQCTAEDMDVRKAFFQLDEEERLILSLSLFGGYKSYEIAKLLKRNENTIRSRQSRALKKLEQMLTD